jgi:CRISPR/Cas system CMR-associated protein Cmr3 (group 5 of RAMP superfamily)
MKLKLILESIVQGGKFNVYHGSNHKFTKFDLSKTAENVAWFSDSIEDIKSGSAGADSSKYKLQLVTPFILD